MKIHRPKRSSRMPEKGQPLGEIVEVGLEHVFDVLVVGGVVDVDVNGGGGRFRDELGLPVVDCCTRTTSLK